MSIKLLLADDSITIQKVIGIIFGGEDYSLTVVDNGKSAVEKARELNPDVLLIDALMPGMSGYEVCEAVRATPALASKPILILTGSFEPFDEEKAKKCGADDFLAKPFESQQIVSKVKELAELGASRAAGAVAQPSPPQPEPVTEPVTETVTAPVTEPVIEPITESVVLEDPTGVTPSPAGISPTTLPSDIWDAFTTEPQPPTAVETAEEPSDSFEPDVFAIVNENFDSQLMQPDSEQPAPESRTGTKWIPVEEHTFEFVEEKIADMPLDDLPEQGDDVASGFGDISFAQPAPAAEIPVSAADFTVPADDFVEPAPEMDSFIEAVSPFELPVTEIEPPASEFIAPTAVPAATSALSEEQLKAAIAAASKEVIERIVWEVVPDLAEALIREAIRKIKEGV